MPGDQASGVLEESKVYLQAGQGNRYERSVLRLNNPIVLVGASYYGLPDYNYTLMLQCAKISSLLASEANIKESKKRDISEKTHLTHVHVLPLETVTRLQQKFLNNHQRCHLLFSFKCYDGL